MDEVERMLIDIRFYEQIAGDAKRTILCQPAMVAAVEEVIAAKGAERLFKVLASPVCPEGKLLIIDEQGLEASFRAAAQRPIRFL